jgi:hypothetical protein
MTDPFADLERELMRAHGKRPRRRPPALAAAPVLAVAAVALALVLATGDRDPERAATAPTPQADCFVAFSQDRIPAAIAQRLSVLSEPETTPFEWAVLARQAKHMYGHPVALPSVGDYAVAAVGAEIVPRDRVDRQTTGCEPPSGPTEPGACLVLRNDQGGLGACFTVAELMEGAAFIDAGGEIIGLAPDSAEVAIADGHRSNVDDNSFHLPGGPETDVNFRTKSSVTGSSPSGTDGGGGE